MGSGPILGTRPKPDQNRGEPDQNPRTTGSREQRGDNGNRGRDTGNGFRYVTDAHETTRFEEPIRHVSRTLQPFPRNQNEKPNQNRTQNSRSQTRTRIPRTQTPALDITTQRQTVTNAEQHCSCLPPLTIPTTFKWPQRSHRLRVSLLRRFYADVSPLPTGEDYPGIAEIISVSRDYCCWLGR
jgi:hypothetical protein